MVYKKSNGFLIFVSTLFLIINVIKSKGQNLNNHILKEYYITDSLNKKDAVLILFSNDTFINFGCIKNDSLKNKIWFSTGIYLLLPNKVLLKSNKDGPTPDNFIENIVQYYRTSSNFYIKENSTSYSFEKYNNYQINICNDLLVDINKQIKYSELKSNSSKKL